MTEDLARERYLAAWEQERRLDDEAWLASVRKQYPSVEEMRRRKDREKPVPGWLGLRPSDLVESRFTYLYEDEQGLD